MVNTKGVCVYLPHIFRLVTLGNGILNTSYVYCNNDDDNKLIRMMVFLLLLKMQENIL